MLISITSVLSVVLLPSFLMSGLISTLYVIKSSFSICFLLSLAILVWCCYSTQFIFYICLETLTAVEKKRIFDHLVNDSMLLQFVVISIGDSSNNSIEILIWALIFIYYSACKVLSITAKYRLQNNQLRNLQRLTLITLSLTISFMLGTAYVFSNAGASLILLINYEGLLILKESSLTLYQLKNNLALSGRNDLGIQLVEILINLCRWLHLAV